MARHLSYINHRGSSETMAPLKSRGYGLLAAVARSETLRCCFVKTNNGIMVTNATLDTTGHYLGRHFTEIFPFTLGQLISPNQQIRTHLSLGILMFGNGSQSTEALPPDRQQSHRCSNSSHRFGTRANICFLSVWNCFQSLSALFHRETSLYVFTVTGRAHSQSKRGLQMAIG